MEYAFGDLEVLALSDIAVNDKYVVIAGHTKNCFSPQFLVYDTTGHLIRKQSVGLIQPSGCPFQYHVIDHLTVDSASGFFYALGHASGTHDTGPFTSFIYKFDPIFGSDTIVDLSVILGDEEYVTNIVSADTVFVARSLNHVYLIDRAFHVIEKVDLFQAQSQILFVRGYFVAYETDQDTLTEVQVFTSDG